MFHQDARAKCYVGDRKLPQRPLSLRMISKDQDRQVRCARPLGGNGIGY